MTDARSEATQLLSRSAKLKLFVMLRRTLDPALLRAHLGEHLRWMIEAEKRGEIFLSGPIARREDGTQLDGMTVVRTATLADAEALAQTDPFVKRGAIAFEMREWTANEGSLSVTVTLSDSTATF
jgi:uncharacterized protein YciI